MEPDSTLYYAYSCKPTQQALEDVLHRFFQRWGYYPPAIDAPKDWPHLRTGSIAVFRKFNIPPGHIFLATKEKSRPAVTGRLSTNVPRQDKGV